MSNNVTQTQCDRIHEKTDVKLQRISDKIDIMHESIETINISHATFAEKVTNLGGFITSQNDLNKSMNDILIELMKNKLNRSVFLSVSGAFISILMGIIGGLFIWTSSQIDSINSKMVEMRESVKEISTVFKYYDIKFDK